MVKKNILTAGGYELQNGMKLNFVGEVTPAKYAEDYWYVEGVGDKIELVKYSDLTINNAYSDDVPVKFDNNSFDALSFGNAPSYSCCKRLHCNEQMFHDRNLGQEITNGSQKRNPKDSRN